jgi:predicted Ser/Thr protein kinase
MNTLGISRETGESLARDVPKRYGWRPAQWSFRQNGTSFIVKDNHYTKFFYRYTVGWFLLRREARIYSRAEGLECIPRCYGRLDRDALVLEEVEAIPLKRAAAKELPGDFFRNLEACIEDLHRRGIVHLDLRQGGNVLLTPEGKPKLVDFESSLFLGSSRLLRALLLPFFAWVDRSAILKLRLNYCPDEVTEEERKRYRRFRIIRSLWPVRNHTLRRLRRRMKHRVKDKIQLHSSE